MEEDHDKGLELTLGLPCAGSPDNSADANTDVDERTAKILNDFRIFLNGGVIPPSFQTSSATSDSANKRKSAYSDEKHSHISITTDEGSTGDNDDAADSEEAEGSSWRNNSFQSDYPAIRPGIAGEVKFGGSGSLPDLPWVSTTGPGPNGKTISGVTYYNAGQIRIVCACHGHHLSPDEFVQHATLA